MNLETPCGRARVTTGFMGMTWDGGDIAHNIGMWRECLRVLKPGGHLLSFGGSRTYHRMACAIEDAGFEIRDQIQWIYGSGFPKSSSQGDGWGTALKPAHEPICMARRPLVGTVAQNREKFGVGAINVEACRIGSDAVGWGGQQQAEGRQTTPGGFFDGAPRPAEGRWPANVIHDGGPEVLECFPEEAGAVAPVTVRNGDKFRTTYGAFAGNRDEEGSTFHADTGSAARFFYCAKADRGERNAGCYDEEAKPLLWSSGEQSPGTFQAEGTNRSAENNHPTVKPVDLMRYLIRLVTPKGGLVLDPFSGSGSTGIAAMEEECHFLGVEINPGYAAIAQKRIDSVAPMFNEVELCASPAAD